MGDSSAGAALLCVVPNPSIDKTAEVERLVPGAIHRPAAMVALPGGKGLNVARVARHLGVPVEVVVLLAGHAGRWVDGELERLGIRRHAAWSTGETRTCLSVLDRSSGLLTEFYEPGKEISPGAWTRFSASLEGAVTASPAGTLVAISGSFPPGLSPDAGRRLAALAQRGGGRVLLDISGEHLVDALAVRPYLVKINAAEAGAVLDRPVVGEADALAAAREVAARGAEWAIVTRGAEGAVGVGPEGVGSVGPDGVPRRGEAAWAVDPPDESGPYSVGSGDAFLAGIAAGLRAGSPFDECLRRGAGAAAASTLVLGQGELRAGDAERLTAAVRLRRLD